MEATDKEEARSIALLRYVRRFGGNRRVKRSAKTALAHAGISLVARNWVDLVLATSRINMDHLQPALEGMINQRGSILCCWHNKLLTAALTFRHVFGRGACNQKVRALISESGDGELIARVFRDLGGNCVRGSSSRRAAEAMKDLVYELKQGNSVLVTPDGPRGPKHSIHDGLIHAARLSGAGILPVSGSFGRHLRFERSWDGFEVPLPFGSLTMYGGEPLFVRRDEEDLEAVKKELHLRMRQVERLARQDAQKVYPLGKPKRA